jgi:DNA-binding beta-propeller fold protein YncE
MAPHPNLEPLMSVARVLIGTCTVLAMLSAAGRLAAASAGGIGDLFVTSDASNLVRAYNGTTGLLLGVFTPSVLGSGQLGIHFGATNGRVLVGHFGGGVDEFDAATGAYIKTYAPGGGWQWAGVYGPNGNVYIGSQLTNDVRQYDVNTGAFINVLCTVPEPADMEYGPNGNLYICSFSAGGVKEVHPLTGATQMVWPLPPGTQANDVAFLPGGRVVVTAMITNLAYVYGPPPVLVATFAGAGWQRPHGVEISPHTGNILIADGVTTQVHEFDPTTYVELNPAFLNPNPGDKIVDLDYRPDQPTPVAPTTWGRLKGQYAR